MMVTMVLNINHKYLFTNFMVINPVAIDRFHLKSPPSSAINQMLIFTALNETKKLFQVLGSKLDVSPD